MPALPERPDALRQATEVLGAIAGIAALVYVIGGAIYYVRLALYGVSGLTVTSALPREFLISVGVLGLLGPWFLGICLYLTAGWWWKEGAHSRIPGVTLPLTLATAGAWVALRSDGAWSWTIAGISTVAVLIFFALWATIIRVNAHQAKPARAESFYYDRPGRLFARAALNGLALVPAGLTLAAGLPLEKAEICAIEPASSSASVSTTPITGRFLGQSEDRVWLAELDDDEKLSPRIAAVPWSGASRVYVYRASEEPPAC